ncbi:unnamed protein product [Phytophthora fragariaefolia]|uniref:Unnamed protein product n=1 Tax=Phytophthora fragariaefolia TaxID=1490495 RepID=A0A9W6XYV6_9STRA|nr:unnamed protein product [Phytophthora fragariaefolia]
MCRSRHINPKTSSEGTLVLIQNDHDNDAGRRHACCICSSEHCRHFLSDDWKLSGFNTRRHFNGDDAKRSQANDVAWGVMNARGNTVFARDELEALFNVGRNDDMEDGEEDEPT